MKSVLLIGLGRFGRHMAERLIAEGNELPLQWTLMRRESMMP